MELERWLGQAVQAVADWQRGFGEYDQHPSLEISDDAMASALSELTGRLAGNYPFFHPRYAGQMLKPPHPAAVAGYLAAMLINPNNHALDGGPATAAMEQEVVAPAGRDVRLRREHLGHLTTAGTIANLEALWVARELHPDRGVAYSADAHYTHGRMCGVLGVAGTAVAADDGAAGSTWTRWRRCWRGGGRHRRRDARARPASARSTRSTRCLAVARRHGVRLHVDAAYGGFFTLLAGQDGRGRAATRRPWRAIADCDSIVVDPHKHGLQPYGCGACCSPTRTVGRFYAHDSPYTYFTSDDLHLGEISLECSRAGAAAAALWLTLRLLPLTPAGLGPGARGRPPGRARLGGLLADSRRPGPLPAAGARHRDVLPADRAAHDVGHRHGRGRDAGDGHGQPGPAGLPEHAAGYGRRAGAASSRRHRGRGRRPDFAQRPDEAGVRDLPRHAPRRVEQLVPR